MVDAAVIKKTQDSLGKVIKKPPLTEKLLSKPPFRYLHDIISEVIKSTGFLEGLFEDHEKTSANVKEKEQKIVFLQKAIDAVGLAIGSQLAARPSKIIAGQEAEKTNEFLQYLGRCAAKGADNEVVKRVKKGEKPGKKSESGKDGNRSKERRSKDRDKERKAKAAKERDSSKSKERVSSKERSKERVSGSSKERGSKERPERGRRDRTRDDGKGKAQSKSSEKVTEKKDSSEERKKEKERERAKEKEERRRRKEAEEEEKRRKQEADDNAAAAAAASAAAAAPPSAQADPAQITGDEHSTSVTQQEGPEGDEEAPLTNGFHEDDAPARIPRPSSAKGARRRPEPPNADAGGEGKPTYAEAVVGATTSEPPVPIMAGKRRERPTSARPAPPRIKKREDESAEDTAVREGSGRPPAGIIVDGQVNQQEDDDEMYVNEEPEETAAIKQPVIMGGSGGGGGGHGGLVQKIIDSQKQYSGLDKQDDKVPIMNQAARQKERAMTKKEIDQLRAGIQTLASSAAPLGKVLDYLQEDLDSMQKELENWRSENKYHETAIKAEESHMEKTLEPLRDQLEDTEQQIIDMINKINTMKCNIHTNDNKIGQMLSTMSFSAS